MRIMCCWMEWLEIDMSTALIRGTINQDRLDEHSDSCSYARKEEREGRTEVSEQGSQGQGAGSRGKQRQKVLIYLQYVNATRQC